MDSGMRKNSKKVTTGCRQPCDILHHWSGKGYLSSYLNTEYDVNCSELNFFTEAGGNAIFLLLCYTCYCYFKLEIAVSGIICLRIRSKFLFTLLFFDICQRFFLNSLIASTVVIQP